MQSMLPNQVIDQLADDLINRIYSYPTLEKHLENSEWDGKQLNQAWLERVRLTTLLSSQTAVQYADEVHEWGFGHAVHANVKTHANYQVHLNQLCAAWGTGHHPWTNPNAMAALISLMEIPGFKIARVSKLTCFLNQTAYAIYDSRVAYALRDLELPGPNGRKRVFPFVGSRAAPAGKSSRVNADSAMNEPKRAATVYVNFLRLLQCAAYKLNHSGGIRNKVVSKIVGSQWTPALIEMALFMAGESREKGAGFLPCCPKASAPWQVS